MEASGENSGLLTLVHILVAVLIVGLILAYAIDKA